MYRFFIALFVLYILFSPFYLFPSGQPQFADMVMAACAAFFCVYVVTAKGRERNLTKKDIHVFAVAFLFVIYTWFLNWAWVVIEGEPRLFLHSIFYTYNTICALIVIGLYRSQKDAFLKILVYAVVVSLGIQFILSWLIYDPSRVRQVLAFNNPNQLGYFAVLCASCVMIASERIDIPLGVKLLVLIMSLWLAALSLSSAALLGIAGLLLIVFFRRPKLALSGAMIATVAIMVFGMPDIVQNQFNRVEYRIVNIGTANDDSLEGRGYDRIVEYPQYLFFGAGEGAAQDRSFGYELTVERGMFGGELHSTPGALLFGYGVIGFALFAWFIGKVYYRAGLWLFLLSVPVAFYGLTHQGLRNTLLWIMIALVWCIASEKNVRKHSLTRKVASDKRFIFSP